MSEIKCPYNYSLVSEFIHNESECGLKVEKDKQLEQQREIGRGFIKEIEQLQAEIEKLKKRLVISPQGDDKIDEFEEAIRHLRFQIQQHQAENGQLVKLIKLAYRNWLEDPDVAWCELGEQLCDGLCNSMGDKEFQEWLSELKRK